MIPYEPETQRTDQLRPRDLQMEPQRKRFVLDMSRAEPYI
jgi:hypothetical protein